jgi:hypothetical protein
VGGMSFLSFFSNPFLLGSAKSLISMGAPFHFFHLFFRRPCNFFFILKGPFHLSSFFCDLNVGVGHPNNHASHAMFV